MATKRKMPLADCVAAFITQVLVVAVYAVDACDGGVSTTTTTLYVLTLFFCEDRVTDSKVALGVPSDVAYDTWILYALASCLGFAAVVAEYASTKTLWLAMPKEAPPCPVLFPLVAMAITTCVVGLTRSCAAVAWLLHRACCASASAPPAEEKDEDEKRVEMLS